LEAAVSINLLSREFRPENLDNRENSSLLGVKVFVSSHGCRTFRIIEESKDERYLVRVHNREDDNHYYLRSGNPDDECGFKSMQEAIDAANQKARE
jgi:hypothetical protein